MLKVWCYEEILSTPGFRSSIQREYWIEVIAIPSKWWSIKEWKRANNFLKMEYRTPTSSDLSELKK